MDLNNFGTEAQIRVTSKEGEYAPFIITGSTASELKYEGGLDTNVLINAQLDTLQKRLNAFTAEQLLAWVNVIAGKKMLGTQQVDEKQVYASDFGEKTVFDIHLDGYKRIVLSVSLPVGIITYGDRPMDILKEQFTMLRKRIAKEFQIVCRQYASEVNIRATQDNVGDLGLDLDLDLSEAISLTGDHDVFDQNAQ